MSGRDPKQAHDAHARWTIEGMKQKHMVAKTALVTVNILFAIVLFNGGYKGPPYH